MLAHSPKIVTDGLVLCLDAGNTKSYPGSGTTWSDLSGNGNTGTLTNGPTYNSANGGSLVFDGVDDYVDVGAFFNYSEFTISLWVNAGITQVTNADILDNNHTGDRNFVLQQLGTSTNTYAFYCINSGADSATSTFTLISGVWYNLTFTWNNSFVSAYINGSFNSNGASVSPINYQLQNLRIGGWYAGGRNWNGKISNFVSYNKALTASEIQQNFNVLRGRFSI